ncbi:MAG: hypothetical protein M1828_001079 [Chrysothrix sp. TS-e1954]|nr:MAG: hypothetical protein M1828_001079 [Chrysothrix sp. TS-e1954]
MVLAPEVLVVEALDNFVEASREFKRWKAEVKPGTSLTMTHAWFAVKGGLVLHVPASGPKWRDTQTAPNREEITDSTQSRSVDDIETSSALPLNIGERFEGERKGEYITLFPARLTVAMDASLIDLATFPSEDDLNDQSKSNTAIRLLTLLQITSLFVQLIARKSFNLAITQLEVVTLAFAVIAVCIYGLNWSCPQDVERERVLQLSSQHKNLGTLEADIERLRRVKIEGNAGSLTLFRRCSFKIFRDEFLLGITLVAALFGGIHCLA